MRFYKSKSFLIMLAIAIVLVTVPTVLSIMGITAPLKNAAATVAAPIQWCATKITDAVQGFAAYFTEFKTLREENAQLREELNSAKEQIHRAELSEEENAFLRDFLHLPDYVTEMSLLDAQVIARSAGNAATSYTLSRGSVHGVKVGMPVITADGVVGSVSEVGVNWCRVTSILELNASAGAYVERSGALGLTEGTYDLREEGLCRLAYLEEGADVSLGDRIVTSGYGSVYPQGLIIGEVIDIRTDDYTRTKVAIVAPAVDFARLSRVMIVTDCEIVPLDPSTIVPPEAETDENGDTVSEEGGEPHAE